MASDPLVTLLLLALGYDSVSVAPQFVPEIKYAVRHSSRAALSLAARDVLAQETAAAVRARLDAFARTLAAET
jgi:signal transduction protein with GAF and PtsI domain